MSKSIRETRCTPRCRHSDDAMTNSRLEIWSDNLVEAEWFVSLDTRLHDASRHTIKGRGDNPQAIDELVRYDRPDIILSSNGEPVLVVEKTREVPSGHNVGQRLARLVCAAEKRVPVAYMFPFDAAKHGEYQSMCNMNARLLFAFKQMMAIHKVPVLAVNWPCDEYGELIDSGEQDARMRALVQSYLDSGFKPNNSAFTDQIKIVDEEYGNRIKKYPKYAKLPESVTVMSTADLPKLNGGQLGPIDLLMGRTESVVYRIGMTAAKCRREDPYTGTQFVYDYAWCRSGERPENKDRNLVLHVPLVKREQWLAANPNDLGRKSSNWYLTANAIVLQDSALILR